MAQVTHTVQEGQQFRILAPSAIPPFSQLATWVSSNPALVSVVGDPGSPTAQVTVGKLPAHHATGGAVITVTTKGPPPTTDTIVIQVQQGATR